MIQGIIKIKNKNSSSSEESTATNTQVDREVKINDKWTIFLNEERLSLTVSSMTLGGFIG